MIRCIIRAPSSFFDTTPLGRIMNRVSRDSDVIANQLPITMYGYLQRVIQLVGIVLLTSVLTVYFAAAMVNEFICAS